MNYLVSNTISVNIFGYNLVNPYPEAIIEFQKFALFENLYPQNINKISFVYPELHMSMYKFTSLYFILYFLFLFNPYIFEYIAFSFQYTTSLYK